MRQYCSGFYTQEAFEPVIVEAHAQAMPDQPRGCGVEHAVQHEAAAARDCHGLVFEVRCSPLGQLVEARHLQLDPAAVVRILPADDQIDEGAVGIEIVEVRGATQQQCVFQRSLKVTVRAFDGAILVGDGIFAVPLPPKDRDLSANLSSSKTFE